MPDARFRIVRHVESLVTKYYFAALCLIFSYAALKSKGL